jgi:hypothetical protein
MIANLINSVEEMKALHALKQRIDKRMTQQNDYYKSSSVE